MAGCLAESEPYTKKWYPLQGQVTFIHLKWIMQPYDANDMVAHPVENKLSRLGYNTTDETITAKFDYPGLPVLV